ncbi:30S ribosomal protein S4e [Candidatus Woesearchaeota archaeon]|nr:30S ribosomal protein S4e [Candidatus Woesearchaeota archaeon]
MGNSLTIKRMAAPTSWQMKRKGITFVTKPMPGAHSYQLGTSLNFILRDVLSLARTAREAKYILNNKEILVNGTRRKDGKYLAGFMDTLSITPTKEHYRLIISQKGTLEALKIDAEDAKKTIAKIIGKSHVAGRVQLNLSDGRNLFVEKDTYKVGDSLLVEMPKQKVLDHFKLEKGAIILLTDGTHIGKTGSVEDIVSDIIIFRVGQDIFRTKKSFAFVIGKGKSAVTVGSS